MVDELSMIKRLLICLTCFAMTIGVIGHVWAVPTDPVGSVMPSVSPMIPASRSPELLADHTLKRFDLGIKGCVGHAHNASGGCTIDAVTPLLSFDAPDRTWRLTNRIETGFHLKSTTLSPVPPPPISVP